MATPRRKAIGYAIPTNAVARADVRAVANLNNSIKGIRLLLANIPTTQHTCKIQP